MEEVKIEMLAYNFADMLEELADSLNVLNNKAIVKSIIFDNNRIMVNIENGYGIMSFSKDFDKKESK